MHYVAVGALSAIALAGLMAWVVRGLREGGAESIRNAAAAGVAFVGGHALPILGLVLTAAIGAVGGAVAYRLRHGLRRAQRRRSGTRRTG